MIWILWICISLPENAEICFYHSYKDLFIYTFMYLLYLLSDDESEIILR